LATNSTLLFYRFDSSDRIPTVAPSVPLSIMEFKPTLFRLKKHEGSNLIFLFWYLFTGGRYRIFYGLDRAHLPVHYSVVLPKFFKFPFLRSDDFEIGPCWTDSAYRGKNIYPAVITHIVKRLKKEGRLFFMLTHVENIPSQKGIEKAGFHICGRGRKCGRLGIYNMERDSAEA
jgi:RimJ/RimL family protein N-acetyltransferase